MNNLSEAFQRTYYWRRDGWRWVVVTAVIDDAGWGPEAVIFKSWRKSVALKVCEVCHESFLQGQQIIRWRL